MLLLVLQQLFLLLSFNSLQMDFIEGEILHIDKPLHWTSFRVVRVIRAKLCQKLKIKKLKVGHADRKSVV